MRFLQTQHEGLSLTRALSSFALLLGLAASPLIAESPEPYAAPGIQMNDPGNALCSNELIELDPAPVSEVARLIERVKTHCENETSCGTRQLKDVLERVIATHGTKHRNWFRRMLTLPRRALVLGVYAGTVIGPGLLTYFLASNFEIPDGQRIILGSSVSTISGMLFGRSGSALERMMGPHIEQAVITVWDPNDQDSWGKIQKALNEKDRLINSQIYNQLLVFVPHFKNAGEAIKRTDLASAADSYAQALLHSYNLFGGLHYYHPSTVGEMRSYLPKTGQFRNQIDMSLEDKAELIIRVCRTIQERPADEIPEGVSKDDLVRFAFGVMMRWMVVHDKPDPRVTSRPAGPAVQADTQPLPITAK